MLQALFTSRRALLLGALLCWHEVPATAQVVTRSLPFSAAQGARQSRPFNHAPAIVEMPDGRLLTVWFSGPFETSSDNVINGAYSSDRGKTWQEASPIVERTRDVALVNPAFLRNGKRVWLFYDEYVGTRKDPARTHWIDATEDAFVISTDDSGATWSKPVKLTTGSTGFLRSNGIVLSTGELIVPAYSYSYVVPKEQRQAYAGVLRSTDNGATWKRYGSVRGDEPAIAELGDGSLLMYLRTADGHIWKSTSHDKGITWAESVATGIAAPDSAQCLYRLKDGRLALAYNNHPRLRTQLSIRLSEDDGHTWGTPILLDASTLQFESPSETEQTGYPALLQLATGNLAAVWTHIRFAPGSHGLGTIKFAEIALPKDAPLTKTTTPIVLSPAQMADTIKGLPLIPGGNKDLIDSVHHHVLIARVTDRDGDPEYHADVDDIFYVIAGRAKLRLGGTLIDPVEESPGEFTSKKSQDWHEVPLEAGSVISVPRYTVHQVMALGMDVTYLVVKAR